MAIAFFYAIGTGRGRHHRPVALRRPYRIGKRADLAAGYLIGAVVMIAAGLVEVWLGVNAEQKPLEEIATPLTAEDAGQHSTATGAAGTRDAPGTVQRRQRRRSEPARHPAGELPALVADVSRLRCPPHRHRPGPRGQPDNIRDGRRRSHRTAAASRAGARLAGPGTVPCRPAGSRHARESTPHGPGPVCARAHCAQSR